MIEVDIRAIRRPYLAGEIWMVAVGYGPDGLTDEDRNFLKLANNDVSDKPEWPIWSAAVTDEGRLLQSFLYYSQQESMVRWLR